MRNIVDKITEGFFNNIGANIDISDDIISIKIGGKDMIILKDGEDWVIDTICDAIVNINPKLVWLKSADRAYSFGGFPYEEIDEYLSSSEYKVLDKFIYEVQWSDVRTEKYICIPKITVSSSLFSKLYTQGSSEIVAKLARKKLQANNARMEQCVVNTFSSAFAMASLKLLGIISKNAKFKDIENTGLIYVIHKMIVYKYSYDFSPKVIMPPSEFTGDMASADQEKYKAVLNDMETLKNDIQLLMNNKYPWNSMVNRTVNDIKTRCQVIARLANKYRS